MLVINNELDELIAGWKESIDGLKLIVTQSPTTLILHLIYIPLSSRGRGYGGKIMQELTSYCDRQNLLLKLTPVDEYGISVEKLRQFYAGHGFGVGVGGIMVRKPLFSDDYLTQL